MIIKIKLLKSSKLKGKKMLKDVEIIRKKLKENGYTNKSIDYKEFLELYEPYRKEMKEKEFAEILGVSYCNHDNMKYKGRRIKILKEENNISEERKEEIRENLRKNGYTNKSINYQEFLELYEPYRKEMKEIEFAKILGILYGNHSMMKNKGQRARILKEQNKISEERVEEIRKTLKENGYTNKLINYKEFLELYKPYKKEMKETEFAEILVISYSNYSNIKNKGKRAKILKEKNKIREERVEEIRGEQKEKGYTNKSINYQEFLELYESYKKEMKEIEFAEILGISYSNYNHMKNQGKRTIILKEEKKMSEKRKEEIRKTLKENGYTNKLINYQEFLELYEPYKKEIKETEFAEILKISLFRYRKTKYEGTKTRIRIEEEKKVSEECKEKIRETLRKNGYTNKLINYK